MTPPRISTRRGVAGLVLLALAAGGCYAVPPPVTSVSRWQAPAP